MVDIKQEMDEKPSNADLMQAMLAQIKAQSEMLQTQSAAIQMLLSEKNERSVLNERRGPSVDALEKQIRPFSYRPEEEITFDNWMERHREIFENDFSGLNDGEKGRILLRKVDDKVDKQFRNHIRPKSPADLSFNEIVSIMKELFGDKRSQFEKRLDLFQLKMSKLRCDDITEFSSIVNRVYEDANISEMKPEQIKAMILLSGIDLPRYTATMFHVMSQISDETPTMDKILKVADNYRKVYGDAHAATNQEGHSPVVNAISKYNPKWHKSNREMPKSGYENGMKKSFCSRCGREDHLEDECHHIRSTCHKCEEIGHISVMCNKWNRTRSRESSRDRNVNLIYSNLPNEMDNFKSNVMMNGRMIEMLVDTGSDITVISESKWREIGSPKRKYVQDAFPICANGTRLKLTGKCRLRMEMDGIVAYGEVYVSNKNWNILGKNFVPKFFRLIPNENRKNVRIAQNRNCEGELKEDISKADKCHVRIGRSLNERDDHRIETRKNDPQSDRIMNGMGVIGNADRSRLRMIVSENERKCSVKGDGILREVSVQQKELSMRNEMVTNESVVSVLPESRGMENDRNSAVIGLSRTRSQQKRLNVDSSKMSYRED